MRKRFFFICSVSICAVCLFAIKPAGAYEFPPYQGISLKVFGDISESYSNNITFSSDEENRIEEFRTMLNLGLNFEYTGKRRSLGLAGRLTRQIFEGSSGIRNSSENINLAFDSEFSEYDRISLRNTFRHTQEPGRSEGEFDIDECRNFFRDSGLSEAEIESRCNEFEEEFGRFTGIFDSYDNDLRVAYSKDISEHFNVRPYYALGKKWSSQEGTNDSLRNTVGLRTNYKYSEATILSLSYSYQKSNFERGEDISRQSIDAGIKQYITRRLYFDGSIGRVFVSSGRDSVSLEAVFRGEVDEKTTASFSYIQGTRITSNQGDTFKNWQITGRLNKLLLEDLSSSFSTFYGQGDYSSTEITDTLFGARLNLTYFFWQSKRGANIKGNLGYSYSNLDSTDENREYTRNSVNSSITLAF